MVQMLPRRTLAALLLLLLSLPLPATALPRERDEWLRVETDHFVFFSDASARSTRRIALNLERLRGVLAELNPGTALGSDRPLYLYVFDNNVALTPYKPLYEGKPANLAGYFLPRPEASYMVMQAEAGQDVERILYHEYLHYVLGNNYRALPLWFNEGMAEFYSTFESGDKTADVGRAIPTHIATLRQTSLIPLQQLFAMDHSSKDYNEGYRQGIFYAQSWALVHYLLLGNPERREQALVFFKGVTQGRPAAETFRAAFQADEAQIERELRTYLGRSLFNYTQFSVQPASEVPLRTTPMAREELLTRLGELLLNLDDATRLPEAEKHFRAALAARPGHAPAQAALCRIEAAAGRKAAALACFETAAQAAPGDAALQLHYARALREDGPADEATEAKERAALQKVVALQPDNGGAWMALANTYVNANPMPAEALQAFEAVWRLRPEDGPTAENLVLALVRSGQREAAAQRITQEIAPRVPARVERAWRVWVAEAGQELNRLLVAQKLDEALPLAEEILRVAPASVTQPYVEQIAELRRVVDHNRFAKRYNEAVALANQQKAEEALAILTDLAATTGDPQNAETARKLATELEEYLKARAPAGKKKGG